VGTVLTEVLAERGYKITGLDVGYFARCLVSEATGIYKMINRDIRDVQFEDLEGIDAIIHLAGLSNDPLGEFNPSLTEQINYHATMNLARMSKKAGVRRFVYASSQSMYGISDFDGELDEDDSVKNPITAYAKTKWAAEIKLKDMRDEDFVVVCMRPSTVFGYSARLRSDVVFNNLVGCGFTTGRIEIKSDGTPWRPVVHVRDVCSAFLAGLEAPTDLVNGRSYNVGVPNGNYTVRDLAEAAGRAVPNCEVVYTGEHGGDSRTYRVSFDRILSELSDWYKPEWTLDRGGEELVEKFREAGFSEAQFRGRTTVRLDQLKHLRSSEAIDDELRWHGA
jgi:nucleoside-diphosphate-sugar epimerase